MYTTYHLNVSELDENFLNSVKSQFPDGNLSITVEKEMDETEYLMSNPANRKHLLDAIEIIMKSDHVEPINIGPDESYTIDEMVRMVSDKEIKHIDGPVGLQVRLTDNTKIKSLGWKPKVSVQEGMQRLKEWIETQK